LMKYSVEEKIFNLPQQQTIASYDCTNKERLSLIVQAYLDEICRVGQIPAPQRVQSEMRHSLKMGSTIVTNIEVEQLVKETGFEGWWNDQLPVSGALACNMLLSGAEKQDCDLFLSSPMSALAGDKLYEGVRSIQRPGTLIGELKAKVQFPDVRRLVNQGRLDIAALMEIRKEALKFRRWLQTQSEEWDLDTIIAYHAEVADAAGIRVTLRKALNLFGSVGNITATAAKFGVLAGAQETVVGVVGAVGSAVAYAAQLGAKYVGPWKPVLFGDWARDRIESLDLGRE